MASCDICKASAGVDGFSAGSKCDTVTVNGIEYGHGSSLNSDTFSVDLGYPHTVYAVVLLGYSNIGSGW